MALTVEQLKEVMKFQLRNLSDANPDDITDDTIHGDVLSGEGFGTANPQRIYKAFIRYTLIKNGEEDKKWPSNWPQLSVAELADKLLAKS